MCRQCVTVMVIQGPRWLNTGHPRHYKSSELAQSRQTPDGVQKYDVVICYLTALARMSLLYRAGTNKALRSRSLPLPACLCLSVRRPVVCSHALTYLLVAACLLPYLPRTPSILPNRPSRASLCDPSPFRTPELGPHTDLHLYPPLKHRRGVWTGLSPIQQVAAEFSVSQWPLFHLFSLAV